MPLINSTSEQLWPYFGAALAGGRNVRGGVTMSYYYSVSLSRAYILTKPSLPVQPIA